eukprot:817757-Prorocentrum_minimum.AAC.5
MAVWGVRPEPPHLVTLAAYGCVKARAAVGLGTPHNPPAPRGAMASTLMVQVEGLGGGQWKSTWLH